MCAPRLERDLRLAAHSQVHLLRRSPREEELHERLVQAGRWGREARGSGESGQGAGVVRGSATRECGEGVCRRASSPRAVAVVGRHPLTPAPRRGAATLAAPRAAAVPSAECHAPKSSWSGGENCSHDGCLPRLAAGESWWTFETSSSRSAPVYSPSYPNSESGATAWTR